MSGVPLASRIGCRLHCDPADRLAELFDAHHERLYRLARRLSQNADDGLDLVQETFLKAARSPKSVPRGHAGEEAWLVRVLVNLSRDQWRKTAVRRRHLERTAISAVSRDEEAVFIARATVWSALATLTPRRRAVIIMHELEGLAVPAIGSVLGVSALTVRWHLSRGRRDLLRLLNPQTGESDENSVRSAARG